MRRIVAGVVGETEGVIVLAPVRMSQVSRGIPVAE